MEREAIIRRLSEQRAQHRAYLNAHPSLKYLFFEVTSRCNLSCLHCGSSCTAHDYTDMPPEFIYKTLDSVERNVSPGSLMLCITGGEPLLYPHLTQAMAHASHRGFVWGMTTNATLINDEKAKALYGAGLASTTISIDGLEASHDWFRNTPGAFRQAQRGLNALIKHAPANARVDVITVVNKRNLGELEDIYRWVAAAGVRSWRVVNMEPIGRALQHDECSLSPEDYKTLFQFIQEKHFTSRSMDVDYGCSHYLTAQYERMLRPYSFLCMAGIQVASVACNGDIIACLDIERRPELVQGHIKTDDFWEVWKNQYKFFRSDRTASSSKCSACPDRDFCAGDSTHTWDFDRHEPRLCLKELLESTASQRL